MKEIEETTVYGMDEFANEATEVLGFQRAPVFRGQADAGRRLLPLPLRENLSKSEFDTWAELASSLMIPFKREGAGELAQIPQTELEWHAVAQHFGLPTRFSAWSRSALVALWFATEETEDEAPGVVWRLLPGGREFVVSQDYEQLPEQPRLYFPTCSEPSMRSQQVCFLSHPMPEGNAEPETFEDTLQRGSENLHAARILIPHEMKEGFRNKLAVMGVDRQTLFPGLRGLCGRIRDGIRAHTDSYEWVFPE